MRSAIEPFHGSNLVSSLKTGSLTIFLICSSFASAYAQTPGVRRISRVPQAAVAQPSDAVAEYPAEPLNFDGTNKPTLKFSNAPAEVLLLAYAELTGKTLLMAPNVPKATITLRSQAELSKEEFLRAIETVLVMNNIAIVPDGDKFVRVFPAADLRKHGIKTHLESPEDGQHSEDGKMVSQMLSLNHISIEEAKKVLEGFKRGEGQIQLFERTNSILVTDTAENVNRMAEILKFMDQPIVNREETNVRPIKFAKAADIKKRLEEIIAESQKEQPQQKQVVEARQTGAPGLENRMINVPGVLRPRIARRATEAEEPTQADNAIIETLVEDAERGIIRGKVQIVADERTNLLIFITRPENMKFFDKIIDVLDVEVQTSPDVIVEVARLEYANAKDVAQMLNDLIGNNTTKNNGENGNEVKSTVGDVNSRTRSTNLSEAADRMRTRLQPQEEKVMDDAKSKLGELKKEDVKILADERSNAIVIMASQGDVRTILGIIKSMDIQLSQVVIETVIVSVTFTDSNETGMDWVQRAMLSSSGSSPQLAFATSGGGGMATPRETAGMHSASDFPSGGGVNAWFTLFDFNMDLVLKAIKSDSEARLMSSPRITTMDNKEASLEATDRIYWKSGTTYYDDRETTSVQNEDVGIKLTITPRINKRGYITLSVKQEIQSNNGYEVVGDSEYPKLTTRKMGADVAVQSGETVVLGGLAQNSITKVQTRVPVLGSIPLLGWFFRKEAEKNERTEIIVFLTPRVMDTAAQMEDDARNAKASLNTKGVWDSSWSSSRLADPLSPERAEEVLKAGENTVAPARYPLTGHLTGLNENNPEAMADRAISNVISEARAIDAIPYVHFSDLNITSRIAPHSLSYEELNLTVTNRPAAVTVPDAQGEAESADGAANSGFDGASSSLPHEDVERSITNAVDAAASEASRSDEVVGL